MIRNEGNQIQARITLPESLRSDDNRVGPNNQLTFKIISEWIKVQGLDEYTEKGLIDIAAKYPTSALRSFRRNFNIMIARVREQRRKDQNATYNQKQTVDNDAEFSLENDSEEEKLDISCDLDKEEVAKITVSPKVDTSSNVQNLLNELEEDSDEDNNLG